MRCRVRVRSFFLLTLGPSVALAQAGPPVAGPAPAPIEAPPPVESATEPAPVAGAETNSPTSATGGEPGDPAETAPPSDAGESGSEASSTKASDGSKTDDVRSKSKGDDKKPERVKVVDEGPAAPLWSFITVQLMIDGTWYDDPGYGAFSEGRDFTVGGIGLGADVVQLDPLTVAVELGLQGGAVEGNDAVAGFNESRLGVTRYTGGLLARYAIVPVVGARIRLAGGVDDVSTAFTLYDSARVRQDEWSFVGAATVGLELVTPPSRLSRSRTWFNSIAGGIAVEGGYSFASTIEVALPDVPANADGEPPIRQVGADLGSIERSGPMLRVSLFVRL